jgi:diaminopimelate epimerase
MKLPFQKYHGAGNDFIMVNGLNDNVFLTKEQIAFLCNRHLGVGADGLIILQRSESNDFTMEYFNSDGNEGSMCGNGGRTVAAYAFNEGLTGDKITFTAFDGEHEAVILDSEKNSFVVKLSMKDVRVEIFNQDFIMVDTGSPHYVCRVDNLAVYDVVQNGRKIRYNPTLTQNGLNVNFMEMINTRIFLRTYERGVEDETLSCGTGVTAAAIAASLWYEMNSNEIITKGGTLQVNFKRKGQNFSKIELTGPVMCVFKGTVNV